VTPSAATLTTVSPPPVAPPTRGSRASRASPAASARLTWHQQHDSDLTRGQRAADRMRNVMGSWGFVGGFIAFMLAWAAVNTLWRGWDDYPYILLNLLLSMLAGLQGAILLIAAKRQDAISAALAQHDFDTNMAAKIDIELLLDINERQLVMIAELQRILGGTAGGGSPEGPTGPSQR
jgi:uncharacterized membrane protein